MASDASSSSDESDDGADYLRPYAWSALALRDTVGAASTSAPPPDPLTSKLAPYRGHSIHAGPPYLRSSLSLGEELRNLCDSEAVSQASSEGGRACSVWVDWAGAAGSAERFRLAVRLRGRMLAECSADAPSELKLSFNLSAVSPGENFVAELSWPSGSRHLHMLAPPARLNLAGLMAPPCEAAAPALETPLLVELDALLLSRLDRGFGVECELLTIATGAGSSKLQQWKQLMETARCAAADGDSQAKTLIDRCALWNAITDVHIMTSPMDVAEEMVRQEADRMAAGSAEHALILEHASLLAAIASGDESARPHKTEYTSPSPPHNLAFSRQGAHEIAAFYRFVRHLGATAPSVSRVWHGGASTHVHVNVCHPHAGGAVLGAIDILGVFFAWVRFDLVTARLARPWMWREPSSAPLYATGSEFAFLEDGLQQGAAPYPSKASIYDIPSFVKGCRSVVNAADFAELSASEQLERLFGGPPKGTEGSEGTTPGALLGRHGSMNLRRVTSYGTLEIRRFHGTLDAASVTDWACVCVGFVEHFSRVSSASSGAQLCSGLLSADDATAACALRDLQRAQEVATMEALAEELGGIIDTRSLWRLVENAAAPSVRSTGTESQLSDAPTSVT